MPERAGRCDVGAWAASFGTLLEGRWGRLVGHVPSGHPGPRSLYLRPPLAIPGSGGLRYGTHKAAPTPLAGGCKHRVTATVFALRPKPGPRPAWPVNA